MIIYFEGPDGSGKSTIATELAKLLQAEGIEFDRFAERNVQTNPKKPFRVNMHVVTDEMLYMAKDKVVHILDRGPLSDLVYRVFDDYKPVGDMYDYIDLFNKLGPRINLVYCRTKIAEQKMLERGDDNPIALTRHKELTKVYDIVMTAIDKSKPYPSITNYDFTKDKNMAQELAKYVKETLPWI